LISTKKREIFTLTIKRKTTSSSIFTRIGDTRIRYTIITSKSCWANTISCVIITISSLTVIPITSFVYEFVIFFFWKEKERNKKKIYYRNQNLFHSLFQSSVNYRNSYMMSQRKNRYLFLRK